MGKQAKSGGHLQVTIELLRRSRQVRLGAICTDRRRVQRRISRISARAGTLVGWRLWSRRARHCGWCCCRSLCVSRGCASSLPLNEGVHAAELLMLARKVALPALLSEIDQRGDWPWRSRRRP